MTDGAETAPRPLAAAVSRPTALRPLRELHTALEMMMAESLPNSLPYNLVTASHLCSGCAPSNSLVKQFAGHSNVCWDVVANYFEIQIVC